jgi:hypothetical protein
LALVIKKIEKEVIGMVLLMDFTGMSVSACQISIGRNTSVLDVFSLDLERGIGKGSKILL